ncbi:SMI1/KNR4 family protein [Streptomyces sp. JJ36]|uniref:SMI1/KNR4 family protein n=1 Tax=Streptomyces sp. JJ36 TaxID=2736645 RepID=UPI001F2EFB4A|nr:SMI1/KNR4 family protein [Streptomyces sp. JJ36]MCF6522816.1 SMI1/KNR4 family protein [Streptomyces sp. JJ36]
MTEDAESVRAAWQRIEAWLRECAPASAALLRPPASDGQLAALEYDLGVRLPSTVRAWYRMRDGALGSHPDDGARPGEVWGVAGWLPGAYTWLRLEEVRRFYELQVEHWDREPGLVPVASDPGEGSYGLYVDCREGEPAYGTLGTWAVESESEPLPPGSDGWPLGDWLHELASALEQHRCLRGPDGREDVHHRPVLHLSGVTWVDDRDGCKDGMRDLRGL